MRKNTYIGFTFDTCEDSMTNARSALGLVVADGGRCGARY
jgi:hypothetical protein